MLTMNINHPDIEKFITAKDDTTKITGANISVKVDNDFMQMKDKMLGGDAWRNKIWNKLIYQAWKSAEPGILFWDKITSESPADCYKGFESTSTNPCGEIPLCPYDSCRLLSINLYNFVDNPYTNKASFNWDKFNKVAYIAQKLMDDVVDLEEEKIDKILDKIENDPENKEIKAVEKNLWLKIKEKLLKGRRTGLSGIGLADTLAALNFNYSSGINFSEYIYKNLAITAYKSSIDMAKDRGAFPIWNAFKEEKNPFIERIYKELDKESKELSYYVYAGTSTGRRNIALLTIPPSGTISLLAGISSGIEPVYQLSYKRRRKVESNHPNVSFTDKNGDCWEEYIVLHPKVKEWNKHIEQREPKDLEEILKHSPWHGSTAYELNPLDRVKIQATIQKWVDHSISSTINLAKETTEEEVANIYKEAWKQGCKGITIYRDGCRDGVLISNDNKPEEEFFAVDAPKRPKSLECDIYYTTSKGIPYSVVIGLYEGKPYEVFATTDIISKERQIKGNLIKVTRGHYKVSGDINRDRLMENMSDDAKVITRSCSALLRHRANVKFVVDTLYKYPGEDMFDFNRVIARILKKYIKDKEEVTGSECPECGSKLTYESGCVTCTNCGYSAC